MQCAKCGHTLGPLDKFCGQCGTFLSNDEQQTSNYVAEMRQIMEDQDEKKQAAEDIKKIENLENPQEVLKAQLKILIAIFRRLERIEKGLQSPLRANIIDFDMPFLSLVGFLFKYMFASLIVGIVFLFIVFGIASMLGISVLKIFNP